MASYKPRQSPVHMLIGLVENWAAQSVFVARAVVAIVHASPPLQTVLIVVVAPAADWMYEIKHCKLTAIHVHGL